MHIQYGNVQSRYAKYIHVETYSQFDIAMIRVLSCRQCKTFLQAMKDVQVVDCIESVN